MEILKLLIIAISLSMDAFSLALAYGTLNLTKKNILLLSIIVGIYHFFMPQIGLIVGNTLINILPIKPSFIVFIVLLFIGIEMILETFKNDNQIKKMSIIEMLLFGLAVSIDSFSVGLGLKAITGNLFLGYILFSLSSFIFTLIGLKLGKKVNNMIGTISTLIGGIFLIFIGITYIL